MLKQALPLIIGILLFNTISYSQSTEEPITIYGKSTFAQNNRVLKYSELLQIVNSDPEARVYMDKAARNYEGATVLGFIGGTLIGLPLGTMIAGGKPNLIVLGAGVLATGISIPLALKYSKHARKAVETYNEGLVPKEGYKSPSLKLQARFTANGIGLQLSF